MKVIFGLGNPGPKYVSTRHNIGFMVLDCMAREAALSWHTDDESESIVVRLQQGPLDALLVKPQTYMNRSGLAFARWRDQLGFEPQDAIVVLDDAALPFGRLRIRSRGGDGGHNGLASILEAAGSHEVPRVRLGIGPAPEEADLSGYVLAHFAPGEDLARTIECACGALEFFVVNGIDAAMNAFNNRVP